MKTRQPLLMLIIGLVIGLLLGIAGSSDSLFGTASDKDDNDSGSASVAESSEAYMLDLGAVQSVLADLYPDSAGAVNASIAAAEALNDDPSNAPAVIADFQETVLPLMYDAFSGTEASHAEAAPENIGLVICFGIKTDPATGATTPYLYTTVPVRLKPIPGLDMPDYWVSHSPTTLVNFQLLACYPPGD